MAPSMKTPSYKLGQHGKWTLGVQDPQFCKGYWSPLALSKRNYFLREQTIDGPVTWMSVTPMELESQALAAMFARGICVVMGYGMGVVAWNMALNPKVRKVIVVEKDTEVIRLMDQVLVKDGPEWNKIEVVNADAFEFQYDNVQTLYVDIWPILFGNTALSDTQQIQKRIHADRVYFWGQELELASWAVDNNQSAPVTWEQWYQFKKWTGLPLIGDKVKKYPELIQRAIFNTSNLFG